MPNHPNICNISIRRKYLKKIFETRDQVLDTVIQKHDRENKQSDAENLHDRRVQFMADQHF